MDAEPMGALPILRVRADCIEMRKAMDAIREVGRGHYLAAPYQANL